MSLPTHWNSKGFPTINEVEDWIYRQPPDQLRKSFKEILNLYANYVKRSLPVTLPPSGGQFFTASMGYIWILPEEIPSYAERLVPVAGNLEPTLVEKALLSLYKGRYLYGICLVQEEPCYVQINSDLHPGFTYLPTEHPLRGSKQDSLLGVCEAHALTNCQECSSDFKVMSLSAHAITLWGTTKCETCSAASLSNYQRPSNWDRTFLAKLAQSNRQAANSSKKLA